MPEFADFARLFRDTVATCSDYELTAPTIDGYAQAVSKYHELIDFIQENHSLLTECIQETYSNKIRIKSEIGQFAAIGDVFALCIISDDEYRDGDIRNPQTPPLTQQIVYIMLHKAKKNWLILHDKPELLC